MRLVLIGAGHAHLYVVKKTLQFFNQGIHVTLISPDLFWYSGLATGMLGGQYEKFQDQIDPKHLIETHGGQFIQDRMVSIDSDKKIVHLESGDEVHYDALSINVGSEIPQDTIPGLKEYSWQIKPVSNLWKLRKHIENVHEPITVTVVGGGASGCEIAANLRALSQKLTLNLVTRTPRLLEEHSEAVGQLMDEILRKKRVNILYSTEVKEIREHEIVTHHETIKSDITVSAIGLVPPVILGDKHGLEVNQFLQSTEEPEIFGAGDCIMIEGYQLPKIGVYGVREAPILTHNLQAFLTNEPMKVFTPQKDFLSILNMGDGTALAIRKPFYWHGKLSLYLKDWIDRYFLWKSS